MKVSKKIFVANFILLLLIVGIFLTTNWRDQSLNAEVKNILSIDTTKIPMEYKEAYIYSLGFKVMPGLDPKAEGKKKFLKLENASKEKNSKSFVSQGSEKKINFHNKGPYCKSYPCSKEILKELKNNWKNNQQIFNELSSRFDNLIGYGGVAVPLPPSISSLSTPVTAFLTGSRYKLELASQSLYEGNVESAVKDVIKLRQFFVNSINHHNSLLFMMVSIVIINDSTNFLVGAFNENSLARKYLLENKEMVNSMNIDFDKILKNFFEVETQAFASTIDQIKILEFIDSSRLNPSADDSSITFIVKDFLIRHSGWVVAIFLKKNETINSFYAGFKQAIFDTCIKSKLPCAKTPFELTWYQYVRNPLGNFLIKIIGFHYSEQLQTLYQRIQAVNAVKF